MIMRKHAMAMKKNGMLKLVTPGMPVDETIALVQNENESLKEFMDRCNQYNEQIDPEKLSDVEMVRYDPSFLGKMNDQPLDVCIAAVSQDWRALRDVKHQTYEICLAAVRQNGVAVDLVNDEFKTKELCMEAFRSNELCLPFLPKQFVTDEMVQKYRSMCE
jgi:hypothetical protein